MNVWFIVFLLIYGGFCKAQNATGGTKPSSGEPPSLGPGNVLVPNGVNDAASTSPADAIIKDTGLPNDLLAKLGITTGSNLDYKTDTLVQMFDPRLQNSQSNLIGIINDQTIGSTSQQANDYILLGGSHNDVLLGNPTGTGVIANHLVADHPHILASDIPTIATDINQHSTLQGTDSHLLTQGSMNGVIGLIDAGSVGNSGNLNDPLSMSQMTTTNGVLNINEAYGLMQDPLTGGLVSLQGGVMKNHGGVDLTGADIGGQHPNDTIFINGNALVSGQDALNVIDISGVGNQMDLNGGIIGLNDINGAGSFDYVQVGDTGHMNSAQPLYVDLGAGQGSTGMMGDTLLINDPVAGDYINVNDALLGNQGFATDQLYALDNGQYVSLGGGGAIDHGLVGYNDAIVLNSGDTGRVNLLGGLNQGLFDSQRSAGLTMLGSNGIHLDPQGVFIVNNGIEGNGNIHTMQSPGMLTAEDILAMNNITHFNSPKEAANVSATSNISVPVVNVSSLLNIKPINEMNAVQNVQPITVPNVQPIAVSNAQPALTSNIQPVVASSVQPVMASNVQPAVTSSAQPSLVSNIQPAVVSNVQPAVISNFQPIAVPNVQPSPVSNVQPVTVSNLQSAMVSNIQPPVALHVQPAVTPNIQPVAVSNVQTPVASNVQPVVASNIQPAAVSNVQTPVASNIQPATASITQTSAIATSNVQDPLSSNAQPIIPSNIQFPATQNVQSPALSNMQPGTIPNIQPVAFSNIQPPAVSIAQPSTVSNFQPPAATNVQPFAVPSIQSPTVLNVQPASVSNIQPPTVSHVQPPSMPSVQQFATSNTQTITASNIQPQIAGTNGQFFIPPNVESPTNVQSQVVPNIKHFGTTSTLHSVNAGTNGIVNPASVRNVQHAYQNQINYTGVVQPQNEIILNVAETVDSINPVNQANHGNEFVQIIANEIIPNVILSDQAQTGVELSNATTGIPLDNNGVVISDIVNRIINQTIDPTGQQLVGIDGSALRANIENMLRQQMTPLQQQQQQQPLLSSQITNQGQATAVINSKIEGVQFMTQSTGKRPINTSNVAQTTNLQNGVRNTISQMSGINQVHQVNAGMNKLGSLQPQRVNLANGQQLPVTHNSQQSPPNASQNPSNNIQQSINEMTIRNLTHILSTWKDTHPNNAIMLSEMHDSGPILHISPETKILTINDLKKAALQNFAHDTNSTESVKGSMIQSQETGTSNTTSRSPTTQPKMTFNNNQPATNIEVQTDLLPIPFDQTPTEPLPQNGTYGNDVYYWDSNLSVNQNNSPPTGQAGASNIPTMNNSNMNVYDPIEPVYVDTYTTASVVPATNNNFQPTNQPALVGQSNQRQGPANNVRTKPRTMQKKQISPQNQVNNWNAQPPVTIPPVQTHTVSPISSVSQPILIENTSEGLSVNGMTNGSRLAIQNQIKQKVPLQVIDSANINKRRQQTQPRNTNRQRQQTQQRNRNRQNQQTQSRNTNRQRQQVQTRKKANAKPSSTETTVVISEVLSPASRIRPKPFAPEQNTNLQTFITSDNVPFDINNNIMTTPAIPTPPTSEIYINDIPNLSPQNTVPSRQTQPIYANQKTSGNRQGNKQSQSVPTSSSSKRRGNAKRTNNAASNQGSGRKSNNNSGLQITPNTEVILGEGIGFGGGEGNGEMIIIGDGVRIVNDVGALHGENMSTALDLTDVKEAIPTSSTTTTIVNNNERFIGTEAKADLTTDYPGSNNIPQMFTESSNSFINYATTSPPYYTSTIETTRPLTQHTPIKGNTAEVLDLVHVQSKVRTNVTSPQSTSNHNNISRSTISSPRVNPIMQNTEPPPYVVGHHVQSTNTDSPVREIGNRNTVNRFDGIENINTNGQKGFVLSKLVDQNQSNNEFILIQNLPVNDTTNSTRSEFPETSRSQRIPLNTGDVQSDPLAITDRFGVPNVPSRSSNRVIDTLPVDQNSLQMPLSPAQTQSATTEPVSGSNVILKLSKSIGLGDLFGANDFLPGRDNTTNSTTIPSSSNDISLQNNSGFQDATNGGLSMNDGLNTPIGVVTADIAPRIITANTRINQTSIWNRPNTVTVSRNDGFVNNGDFEKIRVVDLPSKPLISQSQRSSNPAVRGRFDGRRVIIPSIATANRAPQPITGTNVGTSGEGGRILELPRRANSRRPVVAFLSRRGSAAPRRSLILLRRSQASSASSESSDRLGPTGSASDRAVDGRRVRVSGTPLLDRLAQRPRGDATRYLVPPRLIRPSTRGSTPSRFRRILRLPRRGRLSRSRRLPRIAAVRRSRGRSVLDNELQSRGSTSSSSLDTTSSRRGSGRSLRGQRRIIGERGTGILSSPRVDSQSTSLRSRLPTAARPSSFGPF